MNYNKLFEERLSKYAQLIIRVGINVKKGEDLFVRAPIDAKNLVRLCVKESYLAGARHVYVEYRDEEIDFLKYTMGDEDIFDTYPKWQADKLNDLAKSGCSFLSIVGEDPELFKSVKADRIQRFQKASGQAIKTYRNYAMADKLKWCVVAAATPSWAKIVFPDLEKDQALTKLWEQILDCSRVDENPIKAWTDHNKNLKDKTKFLNDHKFKYLKYKSATADLTVRLVNDHIWLSGSALDPKGTSFTPNIPTEEIYTMPDKYGVNGYVKSTKPLVYGGNVIEAMELTFKDGKIIDYSAETGIDTLKKLIETDEGSHYLGEIALVPYKSPISMTDTVFFNTLFDENASCHFAIGAAYRTNIKGGENISEEDLDRYGVNDSITHVDFMIGSEDLNIAAITEDGMEVLLFKNGSWAF